ncbi:ribonuclease P protein subunit p29-like protein, partial [Dinothrombium tinctorium]
MSSKEGTRNETIGDSLPKEVLDVGDRIGLQATVSNREFCDSFLKQNVPEKELKPELKFLTYCLRDFKSPFIHDKASKKKSKIKAKSLTAKQRKQLFQINKSSNLKYSTFEQINEVWNGYMQTVINDLNPKNDALKLVKCDYHGAYFVVYASRHPSLVGLKGFVVQETKHTFKIINRENKIS